MVPAPHVGLNYLHLKADSFSESSSNGAPIRSFREVTADRLEVPVGLTMGRDFITANNFKLTPTLDLTYALNAGERARQHQGRSGRSSRRVMDSRRLENQPQRF